MHPDLETLVDLHHADVELRRFDRELIALPQKKAASPMQRKSMVEAAEMPLFDQPIAVEIGCRKTASDIIVPKPTQVISAPAPTTTQP